MSEALKYIPVAALIVTVLTALIFPLVKLAYRNQILFSVTELSGSIPTDHENLTMSGGERHIQAELITITNRGLRSLEDVELHYDMASKPFDLEVVKTKQLSRSAVRLEWADRLLYIKIKHLPSSEKITISSFRVGYALFRANRLHGTGGKYKVAEEADFFSQRRIDRLFALSVVMVAFLVVSAIYQATQISH